PGDKKGAAHAGTNIAPRIAVRIVHASRRLFQRRRSNQLRLTAARNVRGDLKHIHASVGQQRNGKELGALAIPCAYSVQSQCFKASDSFNIRCGRTRQLLSLDWLRVNRYHCGEYCKSQTHVDHSYPRNPWSVFVIGVLNAHRSWLPEPNGSHDLPFREERTAIPFPSSGP